MRGQAQGPGYTRWTCRCPGGLNAPRLTFAVCRRGNWQPVVMGLCGRISQNYRRCASCRRLPPVRSKVGGVVRGENRRFPSNLSLVESKNTVIAPNLKIYRLETHRNSCTAYVQEILMGGCRRRRRPPKGCGCRSQRGHRGSW